MLLKKCARTEDLYCWPSKQGVFGSQEMILASEMQFNDLEIDFLTNFIRFLYRKEAPS